MSEEADEFKNENGVSRDVPAGWKLVPEDPTKLMLKKACAVDWSNEDGDAAALNIWQAMLAASPHPQPVEYNPRHPEFVAGFKEGHKAGRARGVASVAQPVQAQPSVWKPISTAPKDCRILIGRVGHPWAITARWHELKEYWSTGQTPMDFFAEPTHWMPLPPPPADQAPKKG